MFGQPVFGGELSYRANLTSLSRSSADFNPISSAAFTNGLCALTTADPAAKIPANCLLRGVPGSYTRVSGETQWKRSFTDPFGQVFTPFVKLRADAAAISVTNSPGVANYLAPGDSAEFRVMPTVGLEYRYPFISVQPWGTQTIEPIAQVIVRPNETNIGKLPNEDSQSLVFDDTNLFKIDKFAGWDRIEGGGRANVGVQYHHAVQSRRLHHHRVRPVVSIVRRQLVRNRRLHQHRSRQRPRHCEIRLRGAAFVPAGPHLCFHHALPVRPRHLRAPAVRDRSPRKLRSLVGFHALREVRRRSPCSAS